MAEKLTAHIIIQKRNDYENDYERKKDVQHQLRELINKHGVNYVALAGDWKETTLHQYMTSKLPNIGMDKLLKAKAVLE